MRSVRQGDLVIIAVYRERFLMPQEQMTGVVLAVRHVEDDATRWVEGAHSSVSGEYADVLVNGAVMSDIPTQWMGVISEAG